MRSIFGNLLKRTTTAEPLPTRFDGLYAQATSAAATQDFQRAIQLYDQAIALNPSHAEARYKRGNALKNLGRLDAALASYDQAIERRPDYAYAYCNRGVVQQSLGLKAAALSSYDQAIALDPTDAMAHYNRALLMQDLFRWDEALSNYNQAISIDPGYADAQFNRSLALLFRGDFENGWRGYEWRWKNARRLSLGDPRNFSQPLWLGAESIAGKRLLLYGEGGLGDTLQFCRYAPLSAALGATVLLEVQAPLFGLLSNLEGVSQLIATGSPLPPFDYQCPLMSLPLAFKTTLDTVPATSRYLHSDQAKVTRWRALLGEGNRPRVGLVWSGNPNNWIDQHRSIPLADCVAHLPPEFQYYCLQRHVRERDKAILDSTQFIVSFDDDLLDFANTAALCECMDVVISVDTSIAHLSGALGQRTWVLVPFTPDWRWLRDRDDSPWYPTVKLYRQKVAGDWNEVFARVANDLHRAFRGESADVSHTGQDMDNASA
jgi:Flp pilus assembly protein TadD